MEVNLSHWEFCRKACKERTHSEGLGAGRAARPPMTVGGQSQGGEVPPGRWMRRAPLDAPEVFAGLVGVGDGLSLRLCPYKQHRGFLCFHLERITGLAGFLKYVHRVCDRYRRLILGHVSSPEEAWYQHSPHCALPSPKPPARSLSVICFFWTYHVHGITPSGFRDRLRLQAFPCSSMEQGSVLPFS